jgi:hypothetical protein
VGSGIDNVGPVDPIARELFSCLTLQKPTFFLANKFFLVTLTNLLHIISFNILSNHSENENSAILCKYLH